MRSAMERSRSPFSEPAYNAILPTAPDRFISRPMLRAYVKVGECLMQRLQLSSRNGHQLRQRLNLVAHAASRVSAIVTRRTLFCPRP